MNPKKTSPHQQFNHLFDVGRYSKPTPEHSPREHLFILEHLFLSSDGFALLLDQHSPLFIRRPEGEVCFSVARAAPYMINGTDSSYLDLKLRVYAGVNIREVLDYVVNDSGLIPKPKTSPPVGLIENTIWQLWEMGYYEPNFPKKLKEENFTVKSDKVILKKAFSFYQLHELIPEHKYPDTNLTRDYHELGLELGLTIADFEAEDQNYHLNHSQLMADEHSHWNHSERLLDFSNPEAGKLVYREIQAVKESKNIDLFVVNAEADMELIIKLHNEEFQKYPSLMVTK